MSLLAYGLIALAVLGSLAGIYGYVHHDGVVEGRAEVQKSWDSANKKARERETKQGEVAEKKTEAARVEIRYVTKTLTQAVDRIVDRPVYRSVCLDPDGLRLARCAIGGKSADSCKPDRPVPPASGPLRWDRSLSAAVDSGSVSRLP